MGKSWFYLTLWRGTPPEFTEYADAMLDTTGHSNADIKTAEATEQRIERTTSAAALIERIGPACADITARTEVVWYVGRA